MTDLRLPKMVTVHYITAIFGIVLLSQKNSLAQKMCLEPNEIAKGNKTITFSVKGHQNQTGHVLTQFQVNEESLERQNNWRVDVKYSNKQHGGVNFFHIKGALIAPPPKPQDYELFPGIGYYKFHHGSKVTFQDASSACTKEGGHLAIINSEEESKVIKTIYSRHPKVGGPWSYVGFHARNKSREFITIFGQPLISSGFYTWHPTEPNNIGGAQFCGCVLHDGLLADVGCEDKLSFFCEYDLSWSEQ